jgi:hypothetical protein
VQSTALRAVPDLEVSRCAMKVTRHPIAILAIVCLAVFGGLVLAGCGESEAQRKAGVEAAKKRMEEVKRIQQENADREQQAEVLREKREKLARSFLTLTLREKPTGDVAVYELRNVSGKDIDDYSCGVRYDGPDGKCLEVYGMSDATPGVVAFKKDEVVVWEVKFPAVLEALRSGAKVDAYTSMKTLKFVDGSGFDIDKVTIGSDTKP